MFFESSGWKVFSIADIDVSVSFWYFALMIFIVVMNPGVGGILFAAAITISVIIHEFGHAVPSKLYNLGPSILLHGFGGLCFHQPADSDWKDILILVMGPLVEIIVGVLAFGVLFVVSGEIRPGYTTYWEIFLFYFAWVSVVWGAINLFLPLFPLDGGQLFHMFLRRFVVEHKAQDIALKTSVTVAIPIGILAIVYQFYFGAFLVAFIVIDNINTLRAGRRLVTRKAKVRASNFVKDSLAEAEQAFDDEDWREAARLCHVIRASNDPVPPRQMDRIWELLSLATTRQGEWEEALGWLKKAPETPETIAAREECERQLREQEAS